MGRSRYKIHEQYYPYFITSSINDGLPLLSQPKIAEIILEALIFLQEKRHVRIHGFVLMENHIHLIAYGIELQKKIRLFKSYTARRIVDILKKDRNTKLLKQLKFRTLAYKKAKQYQVWEEGYHPIQLFNDKLLYQKLDYIHYNPVLRGFVDSPEHWRYSSFRNYNGQKGLIPIYVLS
jgi:REP element-mobilizing transposase RayT